MKKQDKILNKDFLSLCLLSLISSLTTQSISSVLSLYAQSLGATLSMAGTVVGISSVACILILPISGPLTNRTDKRLLIRVAMIILVIGNLGFALAHSIPVLLVCRFLIGVSNGLSTTSMMVMVAESMPSDRVAIGVGYYGLASYAVQSVGPALCLKIISAYGYPTLFFGAAALCLVNFFLVLLLPESRPVINEPFRLQNIRLKEIIAPESIVPAVIGFLFALNNGVQLAFAAPFAEAAGIGGAGMYFAIQTLFLVFARLFLSTVTNVRKVSFAALFSGAFLALFAVTMGFASSRAMLYLGAAFFGIAYGTLLPVTQTVSMELAPPERRGSGSSTYFLGINMALAAGGTLGGTLAENFGYRAMFLSLLVPTACAMLIAIFKADFPVNEEAYRRKLEGRNVNVRNTNQIISEKEKNV